MPPLVDDERRRVRRFHRRLPSQAVGQGERVVRIEEHAVRRGQRRGLEQPFGMRFQAVRRPRINEEDVCAGRSHISGPGHVLAKLPSAERTLIARPPAQHDEHDRSASDLARQTDRRSIDRDEGESPAPSARPWVSRSPRPVRPASPGQRRRERSPRKVRRPRRRANVNARSSNRNPSWQAERAAGPRAPRRTGRLASVDRRRNNQYDPATRTRPITGSSHALGGSPADKCE